MQNDSKVNSNHTNAKASVVAGRHTIHSLKEEADQNRSLSEKIADNITHAIGSMWFLILNITWFMVWIALNVGLIPGITPFDPFPFGFLTMIVSLEAIILAIFVLISQNQAERVSNLRQEVDLQVNMIAEEEMTKLLQMVSLLLEKHGVDVSKDRELQAMITPTDVDMLEKVLDPEAVSKSEEQAKES
jgi:uncharacterized membrane protein